MRYGSLSSQFTLNVTGFPARFKYLKHVIKENASDAIVEISLKLRSMFKSDLDWNTWNVLEGTLFNAFLATINTSRNSSPEKTLLDKNCILFCDKSRMTMRGVHVKAKSCIASTDKMTLRCVKVEFHGARFLRVEFSNVTLVGDGKRPILRTRGHEHLNEFRISNGMFSLCKLGNVRTIPCSIDIISSSSSRRIMFGYVDHSNIGI